MKNKLYVMKEYNGSFRWKYSEPVENPVVAIEASEISDWVTITYEDGMKQATRFSWDRSAIGRIIIVGEENK